jgi:gluconolactonase
VSERIDVFMTPAGFTNGRTVDRQGRFLTCEHGERRVTRTEHDGSIKVLAAAYKGRRLNSPNDIVEHSDTSLWFTDPSYGIHTDYEGHEAESEIGSRNVYRLDLDSDKPTAVVEDFAQPNGLAFSADERQLFIVDSELRHIRVFNVDHGNSPAASSSVPIRKVMTASLLIISAASGARHMTACTATIRPVR